MPIMYFGSKMSENMVKTPEGYLICKNVPIGRTGWMDYYGEELGIENMRGQKIKVYRSPEELFSKATLASFEGKSVTNDHPTQNITLDTVGALERGHIENVREDGDFLMADLFIKDSGLISAIENGKREVSCGYDCLWVPTNDDGTKYEQKEIVGNHVAVVQNGRAGSRVAIKDSKPNKSNGGKEMKNKNGILGKMLKAFAIDAEPDEIQAAMDALNGEGESSQQQSQEDDSTKQILAAVSQIGEAVKGLTDRVTALEEGAKAPEKEGADAEFESLEKDVNAKDADSEDDSEAEVVESETKDEEPEEEENKAPVADSGAYVQLIQNMKPIIMAIPDKAARDSAAKAFAKSVRDSMAAGMVGSKSNSSSNNGGYAGIVTTANKNKKKAMDSKVNQQQNREDAAQKSVDAWNKHNAHYEGGNQ